MTITVITKPGCVDCDATKEFLDRKEIDYNVVDAYDDAVAFALVTEVIGVKTMPVVLLHDGNWWDFTLEPDMKLEDQPNVWMGKNLFRLMQLERQPQTA